jgi:hypothetical protein
VLTAVSLTQVPPAHAHGSLDQTLDGDPGCNATNFPVSVGLSSAPRQEFVPSGTLLSSVGVCLGSGPGATVDIAVRSGTAGSPGGLVGVLGGVPVPAGTTSFIHADFLSPLIVNVGATYVIEVISTGDAAWLGSADNQYSAGNTNGGVGDLAFRSYIAPGAPPPTATSTPTQPSPTRTREPARRPAATNAAPSSTATRTSATATVATGVSPPPTDAPPLTAPQNAAAAAAPTRSSNAGSAAAPVAGIGSPSATHHRADVIMALTLAATVANGAALVFVASRRERS